MPPEPQDIRGWKKRIPIKLIRVKSKLFAKDFIGTDEGGKYFTLSRPGHAGFGSPRFIVVP